MREHAAEGPAPAVTDDAAVAVAPAPPLAAPLTPSSLLGLQRDAGNRAAAALVARAADGRDGGESPVGLDRPGGHRPADGPQPARRGQDGARRRRDLRPDHDRRGAGVPGRAPAAQGDRRRRRRDAGRDRRGEGRGAGPDRHRAQAVRARRQGLREGQVRPRLRVLHARAGARRAPAAACSRAPRRCGGSAAAARRRSRSTRSTSPPTTRRARPTPRPRSPSSRARATGDETADTATAKAHFNKGGGALRGRATTRTPTTSSRWPASSPTAPSLAVLTRPVAASARRPPRGGDRALRAVPRERRAGTQGRRRAALAELRAPTPTGDETVDTATGKAHFNKGAALYEQGDYAHAYDEFTMAGELADRAGAAVLTRPGAAYASAAARTRRWSSTQQYIDLGERRPRSRTPKQMLELLRTHGAAP